LIQSFGEELKQENSWPFRRRCGIITTLGTAAGTLSSSKGLVVPTDTLTTPATFTRYRLHTDRAFTLIELLVVIAIIALLMSILMPALNMISIQSKTVVCQANLHQWCLAFDMFLASNDGKFMSGYEWEYLMESSSGIDIEGTIDDGGDHSWPFILLEYYKNRKLLCCPMAKKRPPGDGQREREDSVYSTWKAWLYYPDDYFYGSYGINSWVYNRGGAQRWKRRPLKRSQNIPMLLDCYWTEGYPEHSDQPPEAPIYGEFGDSDNHMKRFSVNRHVGRTNVLYMDCSVQLISLKQLWRLRWHREWRISAYLPTWPLWMDSLDDPYW
jgi:prepilin-type N-terminal cleavage/methylation domain-containing protein/prepilin-type processing-associated H-X9-DG protein